MGVFHGRNTQQSCQPHQITYLVHTPWRGALLFYGVETCQRLAQDGGLPQKCGFHLTQATGSDCDGFGTLA
jgi:hypothetical protein